MLGYHLAAHVMALAKFRQRLPALAAQPVEQLPAAGVGKGFENFVFVRDHESNNMQLFSCMSALLSFSGSPPLRARSTL